MKYPKTYYENLHWHVPKNAHPLEITHMGNYHQELLIRRLEACGVRWNYPSLWAMALTTAFTDFPSNY